MAGGLQMTLKLDGDKEAADKLARLSLAVQRDIITRAADAAADLLVEPIRQRTPRDTGELAASIDRTVKQYRKSGVVFAAIGPTWYRGRHGYIVEHGTKPRHTRKGYYRGSGPAHPFVEPTYREREQQVIDVIADTIRTGVEAFSE